VCTRLLGCSGAAPFCDTTVQHGACEQCLQDDNCTPWICDPSSHKCVVPPPDAGPPLPPDAAWTEPLDAGPGTDDGGGALGPDGGVHCINRGDAGAVACTSSCADGFHCEAGQCVLNGGSGPVQVTLRWDQPEDLDLHVVEPLPSGGSCEIWYDDSNNPKGTSSCGARGSLDLDSNAGCSIDDVDIENVIYPQGSAPLGTYTVRVDYYANCFATSPVPFEVTVRANGVTNTYCGSFLPSDADSGGSGAGVLVTTFHVP
jgi:hypothetical protein